MADIAQIGNEIDKIPVHISYRIIQLFSGHLYTNPAKAIEELIVNSYDAFAKTCRVWIPLDWAAPGARMLVWDDGQSMDIEGLKELWLIAETCKRLPERENEAVRRGRLTIGKFGIGKLASYVLGNRITHICRKSNRFLAVTMDYSSVIPEQGDQLGDRPKEINLPVRSMSSKQVATFLESITLNQLSLDFVKRLTSPDGEASWTLVVVDKIREDIRISMGKLKWIISTALPLSPDFSVFLNDMLIPPSKLETKILKKWKIGKDDKAAKNRDYDTGVDATKPSPFNAFVNIPGIGKVSGEFALYEDSLVGGKSEDFGRSHGFFVMVRGRLINHEEPLFGTSPLSHSTFNRLHAVVYADGLDDYLVASREGVSEVPKDALKGYLSSKFNEVRDWYEAHLREMDKEKAIQERIEAVPGSLARLPLKYAIEKAISEKWSMLHGIRLPPEGAKVVNKVTGFELSEMSLTEPLAVFDAGTGNIKVNINHPFYVNYVDSHDIPAVAAAEIMLEAYLYEAGYSPDEARVLMTKRDDLLRALVRRYPRNVFVIAQKLRESVHDSKELEEACHSAFEALGFQVLPMAGSGEPEGLAVAVLAPRYVDDGGNVTTRSYSLTYDAKSSQKDKVKSGNLQLSGVARHRDKHKANYCVIIAVDFQTRDGEESKAIEVARKLKVCLIKADDFARLVRLSGLKSLPLDKLESLFKERISDKETREWIDAFEASSTSEPNFKGVLETIYQLQMKYVTEPPSFAAVKHTNPIFQGLPESTIKEWAKTISRLVPELVRIDGDRVEILQKPEQIMKRIKQIIEPSGSQAAAYEMKVGE